MPGGAPFGPVGVAAVEQRGAGGVKALLRQQRRRGFVQGGGMRLRAQVQPQPRGIDQPQLLAAPRRSIRCCGELLPGRAVGK
ncbi:hypothetical protein G6F35_017952 [Rhizopus arrhizus]|nr:hypothetical protein G6F31_016747 [Rhizopus arrhizus]KAG1166865.1 hypothetical protein G6F35_017952 [Rhizopus arrhizus]